MASIFKKTYTKPVPRNAEIFERKGRRLARWKDRSGKQRTARVTIPGKGAHAGQKRVLVETETYYAKYRDAQGHVTEVPTGCRDATAARSFLQTLVTRADKVRSGMRTAAEDALVDHLAVSLDDHIEAYLTHLEACETSAVHRENVRRSLKRVNADCGFKKLTDVHRDSLECWLVARSKELRTSDGKPMSARTRNTYLSANVAFCNWCVETGRLAENPLTKVLKANEDADPRRKRRSMTEEELIKLLFVTSHRPLAERGRVAKRKDKGEIRRKRDTWNTVPLEAHSITAAVERARLRLKKRPDVIARLNRLGRERALIYKTLVLTGLRKGELASLTVGQLCLDEPAPYVVLNAADEKNGQGSKIPIRKDLATDLAQWLADPAGRTSKLCHSRPGNHHAGKTQQAPSGHPSFQHS